MLLPAWRASAAHPPTQYTPRLPNSRSGNSQEIENRVKFGLVTQQKQ